MDEFDKANKIEHPIKSYEKKVIKPINNDLTNVQNFQQMIILIFRLLMQLRLIKAKDKHQNPFMYTQMLIS